MYVELFKRILKAIGNYDDYFTQKIDAVGKDGLSHLQKMIAAMRMLAYGCPANILDEYVQIGESTAIKSLKRFCDAVIGVFEKQYLRKPNTDNIARLLQEGEDRGFPGGSSWINVAIWVDRWHHHGKRVRRREKEKNRKLKYKRNSRNRREIRANRRKEDEEDERRENW
ncbi:hypothetical protein EZV62_000606 [Acer yangbiense]|uniref:Uncharacterized protein n=1 Tax=Acer yangbiense TaxID=1000413 RepID=A0A5C7IRK7_9ROSI|nr:hypothetical protein EZV62_000606 [Acer yangbiense]